MVKEGKLLRMNEFDWVYRNRVLSKLISFGSLMIFIGAVLFAIGIWFVDWSWGAKLCISGIWLILVGFLINKGAKIAQKKE